MLEDDISSLKRELNLKIELLTNENKILTNNLEKVNEVNLRDRKQYKESKENEIKLNENIIALTEKKNNLENDLCALNAQQTEIINDYSKQKIELNSEQKNNEIQINSLNKEIENIKKINEDLIKDKSDFENENTQLKENINGLLEKPRNLRLKTSCSKISFKM